MSHKIDCLECFIAGERQGEETGSLVEMERIIKLLNKIANKSVNHETKRILIQAIEAIKGEK